MTSKFLIRALGMSAVLTAAASATPAMAQGNTRVLQVPCCRCLDGNKQTVSINTGTAGWVVARPNTTAFSAVIPASNTAWATSLAPAAWVGPAGAPTTLGDYTYQIAFNVPRCTIPGGVSISGRFLADNGAKVYLDGATTPVASSLGTPTYGFHPGSVTPFTITGIAPGNHILRVVVNNSSSVTALALQGAITVACPNNLTAALAPATVVAGGPAQPCGCVAS